MHVLILEDDLELGGGLQLALKSDAITSEWFRRVGDLPVLSANQEADGDRFDAALLDVALPDGSGLDVLARWRRAGVSLATIILTARGSLQDRLSGLHGGADDYVVKPFAPQELIARLRAVVRRSARQASDVWEFGELAIEPRAHVARLAGDALALSPREFALLVELARLPSQVIAKGALAQRLVPLGDAIDFGALEVHVFNLRRKIGGARITTVRGVGYMFCP